MRDPYLFEDIDVLKNKFNIRDAKELELAESELSSFKLIELDENPPRSFSVDFIKFIHKYVFENVYEWAGEYRSINIYKEEPLLTGLSVEYCDKSNIEKELKHAVEKLNQIDWIGLDNKIAIIELAKSLSALWRIHPFREGNTRTVITFFTLFLRQKGFEVDRELLKKHSAYVRNALVMASIDKYAEYEHLEKILADAVFSKSPDIEKEQTEFDKYEMIKDYKVRDYKTTPLKHKK